MDTTLGAGPLSSEHLPEINLILTTFEGALFSPFTDRETEVGELPEPARGHTVRQWMECGGPHRAHPS